jgi:hypothetical protein
MSVLQSEEQNTKNTCSSAAAEAVPIDLAGPDIERSSGAPDEERWKVRELMSR